MGYTEKYLTSSFSRSAPNRVALRRVFGSSHFPMHRYMPAAPHFSTDGGRGLQSEQQAYYGGHAMEQYIAPMYDMMAHQQCIIEQQQKNQQEQSSTVLAEQNTLIKEMFFSFESSFKSMLGAMSSMMETNNKLVVNSQRNHPKRRASDTPEVFTKAVPVSQERRNKVANAPIHVGIDPDTGKISRQSSGNNAEENAA